MFGIENDRKRDRFRNEARADHSWPTSVSDWSCARPRSFVISSSDISAVCELRSFERFRLPISSSTAFAQVYFDFERDWNRV